MHSRLRQLSDLYALDLGTTKFALATVREDPTGYRVQTVSVAAGGMRRGMLANLEEAKAALAILLETAEKDLAVDVRRVVVGVAGSHLQSHIRQVELGLEGSEVRQKDVEQLVDLAEEEGRRADREMLHTVPLGYRIDDRETVSDPKGFKGRRLFGEFLLIDADKDYLRDLIRICNDSGLQVVRLFSEPFASASVTVPDESKEAGVALADIGGGTTDGIIFQDGLPRKLFTVNVAGEMMTKDLAVGLNLPKGEADALKRRFGIRPRNLDEVVTVQTLSGTSANLPVKQCASILMARVHELCVHLSAELKPFRGQISSGLLLTGGGSGVLGMSDYYQKLLKIPVRQAEPHLRVGPDGEARVTFNPGDAPYPSKFATAVGLLNLELCRLADEDRLRKSHWRNRYLGQFINWLKELS